MSQHLLNRAISLHQSGRLSDAIQVYQELLVARGADLELNFLLGLAYIQNAENQAGLKHLAYVLQHMPNHLESLLNRGIAYRRLGWAEKAINDFDRALVINPNIAAIHINRGNALNDLHQAEAALLSFKHAIALEPNNVDALINCGLTLNQLDRPSEAIECIRQAVVLAPEDCMALQALGSAFHAAGQSEQGLAQLNRALELCPEYPEAYAARGDVLEQLNRNDEALLSYGRAIELRPELAAVYTHRGNLLCAMGHHDQALADYNKVLMLCPGDAFALSNRSNALNGLNRWEEALASAKSASAVAPDLIEAYVNEGNAWHGLGCYEEAIACHGKALELNPDFAEAYSNRANAMAELKMYHEALTDYQSATQRKDGIKLVPGMVAHIHMILGIWDGFEERLTNLALLVQKSENASSPFPLQALLDDPCLQQLCAENYSRGQCPTSMLLPQIQPCRESVRIRIGYFSSDFGDHPVTHLLLGLLERHDKSRFEITAFSLVDRSHDEWRQRVIESVDHFLDVSQKTDLEIAELARSLKIDIAIDLNGHTKQAKTGVFAYRAAPIQASYLGFLGTMGASYYDYLIADAVLIPHKSQAFYSEKIAYLPCYQCNDPKFVLSEKTLSRRELNLPDSAFVFCSFNNNYKITPTIFDSWMRILHQTPGSVLWIYVDNQSAKNNLTLEAKKRGIQPERLIYALRMPLKDHLRRLQLADLFLDTYPYNAGATASNALRVGLPVLTRAGESFPSRYGASLLEAVGLPELVTYSSDEYESLAVALAMNPDRLEKLRVFLRDSVKHSILFDASRFARSMEGLYEAMYKRSVDNLPPECVSVE